MSVHEQMNMNKKNEPTGYPTRKKKWEEDYVRVTYYVDKDIAREIEFIVNKDKGGKTTVANDALADWLYAYQNKKRFYPPRQGWKERYMKAFDFLKKF